MTNIILGGSHRDVKKTHPKSNKTKKGPHYDSHHILAKKSYIGVLKKVSKGDGPAIRMRKRDHKRTASYGRGKRAKKFSAQQKKLLQKGKYSKAWMMEVKSSRRKFGKKYDKHYVQAEKQLLKLDKEKKIKLEPSFKKELKKRQVIAKKYGDEPRIYRKKLSKNYDHALKKHPKKKNSSQRSKTPTPSNQQRLNRAIAANSKNRIGTASKKTLQAGVTAVRRRKR